MPAATALLAVTDLRVEFPVERVGVVRSVRVVDGVSFTLARGEALGIVGESGCGKSMTAWSILGLVPQPGRLSGGRIEFEGRDLVPLRERDRRALRGSRIGFVGQDAGTALNPVLTVGDQIADALLAHQPSTRAAARKQAVALLDAVRIPRAAERAGDYPHQLSGGQRQRVLLAAALACKPSLLIADEPTTALDVTVQAEILDLLRQMRADFGLSLLLITHDLGVVAAVTDRIAVMYAGRLVETGPTADVLASARHPYTHGLLASVPGAAPGARLRAIPGSVPDLSALPPGCAFAPRCPDSVARCGDAEPGLVELAGGRRVRCILHAEGT